MDRVYDVFLCYSSHDEDVVHDLAVGLADRDLSVWFRAWELKRGAPFASQIEAALQESAALVLCMSQHALTVDWPLLQDNTVPFRERNKHDRRFIPVRLDDVQPSGWLAEHMAIDWRMRSREGLDQLARACRRDKRHGPLIGSEHPQPTLTRSLEHRLRIRGAVFRPGATHVLTVSADHSVHLLNLSTQLIELKANSPEVPRCAAFHPREEKAIVGGKDLRQLDLRSGMFFDAMDGHSQPVICVAYDPSGETAISGSDDNSVRLWDVNTRRCISAFEGHLGPVWSVQFSPDGSQILSGSADHTMRLWDSSTGECLQVLDGHTEGVMAVRFEPRGQFAISGSVDRTLRQWNLATAATERVMEGHTGRVWSVGYLWDGTRVLSGSSDGSVRIWDPTSGVCDWVLGGSATIVIGVGATSTGETVFGVTSDGTLRTWAVGSLGEPHAERTQARYSSAKVVIVGEARSGKTGLAMRLALNRWEPTDSTVGAWATRLPVQTSRAENSEGDDDRELWIWDFGGQADQRLIHQLYLGDTALAVLVFDGSNPKVVQQLSQWNDALTLSDVAFPRLLVAGRTDEYPVQLDEHTLVEMRGSTNATGYFETSAKTGRGCDDLRQALPATIDWSTVPVTSSPALFRLLKQEILGLRERERVLTTAKELHDWLPGLVGAFNADQLTTVIKLLTGPGVVMMLGFGDYILLRPELLNSYAQAVIRSLLDDPDGHDYLLEERVLRGGLAYPAGFDRLPEPEERVILLAMHRMLIERSMCIRDEDPEGRRPTTLLFPSYLRRLRPPRPQRMRAFLTYSVDRNLLQLYGSLVVRIHHTEPFRSIQLWHHAADFRTRDGVKLGLTVEPFEEHPGAGGLLELYAEARTPPSEQALFARYVEDHVREMGLQPSRQRNCPRCGALLEIRPQGGSQSDSVCNQCGYQISIWDQVQVLLTDGEVSSRAYRMGAEAAFERSSESRERELVGDVMSVVAQADQICREVLVSDHGIDVEIEFRNDVGEATGYKVYAQLKAGDSHLRRRKRDSVRLFRLKKRRHADYWADQAFPVMLIIGSSVGIEWMEVRDMLRMTRSRGPWPPTQIEFVGAQFDVAAVRRWRRQLLRPSSSLVAFDTAGP